MTSDLWIAIFFVVFMLGGFTTVCFVFERIKGGKEADILDYESVREMLRIHPQLYPYADTPMTRRELNTMRIKHNALLLEKARGRVECCVKDIKERGV